MELITRKKWGWLFITLTAVVMILLRWSHIGVTHYNWFVVLLISWTVVLLFVFRYIGRDPERAAPTEERKGV